MVPGGQVVRHAGALLWAAQAGRPDLWCAPRRFTAEQAVARSAARWWAARGIPGRGEAPSVREQGLLRQWRRWAVQLIRLRFLRRLTRALIAFLRRRGGKLHWRRTDRLQGVEAGAQDSDSEKESWEIAREIFVRTAFARWRARTRLAHTLAGRRRSFFARRRSWWRRAWENESFRAGILRVLAKLLRWVVSGRGRDAVSAGLGAAGTALLLEGPGVLDYASAGLLEGNATVALRRGDA